ncbi:MAG: diacylglycerol kinase family protein, partial [Minicystis sp.]
MQTRRIAVLLNRNAQGVRPSVVRRAAALIEARDLFVTSSREEAREAARTMIARGTEVVCVGGGDGTFIQAAADLLAEAAIAGRAPPMLLPLRLGSGNAIADVAGASANSGRGL